MAKWGVAEAKARFSAVLDKAETEGPQLVTRRKREFYVVTKEQLTAIQPPPAKEKPFVSAWDALKPSSGELFDVDFPRLRSKARAAKF
jgi:antitoxin Phd